MQAGDEISNFSSTENFIEYLASRRGQQVQLEIRRDDEVLTQAVTLRTDSAEGVLGVIVTDVGFARSSFFGSLRQGLETSLFTMAHIFVSLGQLVKDIFTTGSVSENVVGPIGIFSVAGQLGSAGFVYLLQLIATISLNLAVLNVIPLPALDGGKLLFILIEKVTGKPIHYKGEFWSIVASFCLLLVLMLAITVRDISALL